MAFEHLRKIVAFFEHAHGEENGRTRAEILEFVRKLYNHLGCECRTCLLREFHKDLRFLRSLGVNIYASKNVYETRTTKDGRQYQRMIQQKPKRYFHLQTPTEFDTVIRRLESIAAGLDKRVSQLNREKEVIKMKEELREKRAALKKKIGVSA